MPTALSSRLAAFALGLVALAACAEGAPTAPAVSLAEANVPQHTTSHGDADYSFSCGTFDITVVGTLFDISQTVFFDGEGDPLRVQGLIKRRLVVTNVSTGKAILDKTAIMFEVDFRTGIIVNNGKFFNIKDGIPIRDIGRFVFNEETGEILFEAGPHDVGGDPLETFYCQALA
jgi:hypothetical protein